MISENLIPVVGMITSGGVAIGSILTAHLFERRRDQEREANARGHDQERIANARVDQLLTVRMKVYRDIARKAAKLISNLEQYFFNQALYEVNLVPSFFTKKPFKAALLQYLVAVFEQIHRVRDRDTLFAHDRVLDALLGFANAVASCVYYLDSADVSDAWPGDNPTHEALAAIYDPTYEDLREALREESGIYALDEATKAIRIQPTVDQREPEAKADDIEAHPGEDDDEDQSV